MAHSKKKAKTMVTASNNKSVVQVVQTGGYFGHSPTFSFSPSFLKINKKADKTRGFHFLLVTRKCYA